MGPWGQSGGAQPCGTQDALGGLGLAGPQRCFGGGSGPWDPRDGLGGSALRVWGPLGGEGLNHEGLMGWFGGAVGTSWGGLTPVG